MLQLWQKREAEIVTATFKHLTALLLANLGLKLLDLEKNKKQALKFWNINY